MITVRMTWDGKRAVDAVIGAAWEGLVRAVVYYHTELLQALNTSAGPVRVKRTRNTVAGAKGSSYTIYTQPSKPGEPPHKRTGWLQGHVQYELDENLHMARAGLDADAIYGLFLELGTRFMHPRPWLLATLEKCFPQLQALARSGKVP